MKIKRCVEHKSNSNEKKKSILPLKGSDLNTNPSRLMSCNYKNQIRIYLLFTFVLRKRLFVLLNLILFIFKN